jgi:hypothetical protein
MSDPTKNIGPWRAVHNHIMRAFDFCAFHSARLAAVENRLAALDGGHGKDDACRAALDAANVKRLQSGGKPLNFEAEAQ